MDRIKKLVVICSLCLLASAALGASEPWTRARSAEKTTWEYKVVNVSAVPSPELERMLNRLGSEGWELVQVGTPAELTRDAYIFKRAR